ncbi:MAG: hypothetical protein KKE11_02690 [Gammaproteobacteria bacterium]|nr:hypothetical protein [Gammaproteobacteria bacterium]
MRDIIDAIPINGDSLKFIETVRNNFVFLEREYNFKCIKASPTFVRYESDNVFVNIYHDYDRLAYEISADIGCLNKSYELCRPYSIGFVMRMCSEEEADNYKLFVAKTPEAVKKGIEELVIIFKKYTKDLLKGDSTLFDRLQKKREEFIDNGIKKDYLSGVRSKVETAFNVRKFSEVVKLYESMIDDLTPVESKKLEYARKHCSSVSCLEK